MGDGFPARRRYLAGDAGTVLPRIVSTELSEQRAVGGRDHQGADPALEKTFRLIPEPYGRIVEGASTGGWEALALQLHYPEHFGGAWVFNPDPIDFTRYHFVDVYKDENMFHRSSERVDCQRTDPSDARAKGR